jgi:hypothetical protein
MMLYLLGSGSATLAAVAGSSVVTSAQLAAPLIGQAAILRRKSRAMARTSFPPLPYSRACVAYT